MSGLKGRIGVIAIALAFVAAFMAYAFWPRALLVDIGAAQIGRLQVTIDEEAKTRVRDAYMVSAPIDGRLLRLTVDPGDAVVGGQTIVARISPNNPALLDVRTEEQARAAIAASEAALALARAEIESADANAEFAEAELARTRTLRTEGVASAAALDNAERAARAARAAQATARAAVDMRDAELENARAMLVSFSAAEPDGAQANVYAAAIPIVAPVSGRILRILNESEMIIGAGAPILEIGDPEGDLEIVAELLSTDAVKVSAGDLARVENWGGPAVLDGFVDRVEPWGFTKYSALGVEEQRVNVIIGFDCAAEDRRSLGHGYRVETKIVIWEKSDALTVPSSAVFNHQGETAVFRIENGRARLRVIAIDQTNGLETAVVDGLNEGDPIILYPGNQVFDGARVRARPVG